MTIKTVNPTTEEVIQEYENITKDEIKARQRKLKRHLKNGKKIVTKERVFYTHLLASLEKIRKTLPELLQKKWEKLSRRQEQR